MGYSSKKGDALTLPCASSAAYRILTDFNRYFDWIPFLTNSKTLAVEGDLALAEFQMRPPYSKLVVESIHSANEMVVVRKISGDSPFREMTWQLDSRGEEQCEVALRLSVSRGLSGALRMRPVYWNARDLLTALDSRVRVLSGDLEGDLPFRQILDISETEEGLVAWFEGKRYLMTPLPEERDV